MNDQMNERAHCWPLLLIHDHSKVISEEAAEVPIVATVNYSLSMNWLPRSSLLRFYRRAR